MPAGGARPGAPARGRERRDHQGPQGPDTGARAGQEDAEGEHARQLGGASAGGAHRREAQGGRGESVAQGESLWFFGIRQ